MQPIYRQVTIVAPGLLGGSLALACRERHLAAVVMGVARRKETLDRGMQRGAFDRVSLDLSAGVRDADLVVIGTPVRASFQVLRQLAPSLPPGCIVTDVGSTKSAVMEAAREILGPGRFIGGHPMAGSHRSGILAARSDLFGGCKYLLTHDGKTPAADLDRLERLVRGLGAVPLWLDAATHDRLVARISHLPHLAACALVESARGMEQDGLPALSLAATGFRDCTRIAAGPPGMWTDICLTNQPAILESLDVYIAALTRVRAQLAARNEEDLTNWLDQIAAIRNGLEKSSGTPGDDTET